MGVRPENQRLVEAFGQSKTIREWVEDSRCSIDWNTLHLRLYQGWDAEEAITSPPYEGPRLEAFGEWKTLKQWAQDSRCIVEYPALASRLHREWNLEDALTKPLRPKAKPQPTGTWAMRAPGPHEPGQEAFGESKSLKEWASDARCAVPYYILRDR